MHKIEEQHPDAQCCRKGCKTVWSVQMIQMERTYPLCPECAAHLIQLRGKYPPHMQEQANKYVEDNCVPF